MTLRQWADEYAEAEQKVAEALRYVPTPDECVSKYTNPYLEQFAKLFPDDLQHNWIDRFSLRAEDFTIRHLAREVFIRPYAFSVPTDEAVETIALLSPLIEIGAGTGYWAGLLAQAGADILAFDKHPPNEFRSEDWPDDADPESPDAKTNHYHGLRRVWHPVERGYPETIAKHPERNLFLSWPPMSSMAAECLARFTGPFVAFIGEGRGGCTADDAFYNCLDREFERVGRIDLPQWTGIHDRLEIHARRDVPLDPERDDDE
jgi:hypothetical protein